MRSTSSLDPVIIYVLELDDVSSVKMFMEITGELTAKEIYKLVMYNPKGCIHLLLPELDRNLRDSSLLSE